jgi:coenzyme F420-dependent glucose-6-phosphate dehydrogenase
VPAYYLACATEQFAPRDLLRHSVEAERAYFDGICGVSGQAWEWLGAAGQATEHIRLGAAVIEPGHRFHPELVAHAFATLASRFPGRPFLGLGPELVEQLAQLEVHPLPARRPPVYVSASDEDAAHLAGRLADGIWTLADRERAPTLIEAYHEGCAEAGHDAGEILLQASFSLAETQEPAFDGARAWKGAISDEYDTEPTQRHVQATVTNDPSLIVSPDPDEHVERIREIQTLGATAVVLMNVSAAAPLEAVRVYGREVLPKLRG